MTTCKLCGKQIEESAFEFFFENPEDLPCADCKEKMVKKVLENKENYSVNKEEVF